MNKTDGCRILLVDLGGFMGGVEAYLERLAAILIPEAELYCVCALNELAERLRKSGVHVIKLPLFRRLRLLRFLTALLVLPYVLIRHRIDIVQINGLLEAIVLLPARLLGRRAIYTRHGPFETGLYKWYQEPAKFLPRVMARYCVHLASHVVCVSETVGALVRTIVPQDRVTVIPNWVRYLPALKARFSHKARLNLLYVGRLERYKGLHLVLEALRDLPGVRLTVAGTGSYQQKLERLVLLR
jgi:glycosyltransferase involved in cell wall biosynthesis